jgi:hypothetical protein
VSRLCASLHVFNQQVDDLRSIDALEEEIFATGVVMIFVSKGYFQSKSKRAHSIYSCTTHVHRIWYADRGCVANSISTCARARLPPRGERDLGTREAFFSLL